MALLRNPDIGAVGLQFGPNSSSGPWSIATIHPSFLVIRRDFYHRIGVSIKEERVNGEFIDVAIPMGRRIVKAGYKLFFVGSPNSDSMTSTQKVFHSYGGSRVLNMASDGFEVEAKTIRVAKHHIKGLKRIRLLDEFMGYVREAQNLNPLCARYLD